MEAADSIWSKGFGGLAALYGRLNLQSGELRSGRFSRSAANIADNASGVSGGAMEAGGGEELVETFGDCGWV